MSGWRTPNQYTEQVHYPQGSIPYTPLPAPSVSSPRWQQQRGAHNPMDYRGDPPQQYGGPGQSGQWGAGDNVRSYQGEPVDWSHPVGPSQALGPGTGKGGLQAYYQNQHQQLQHHAPQQQQPQGNNSGSGYQSYGPSGSVAAQGFQQYQQQYQQPQGQPSMQQRGSLDSLYRQPISQAHQPAGSSYAFSQHDNSPGVPYQQVNDSLNQYQQQQQHAGSYEQDHGQLYTPSRSRWQVPNGDNMIAAGGGPPKLNDIPRLGRGVHAANGARDHLRNGVGGLAADGEARTNYVPYGAARNDDSLGVGHSGITGGHTNKDGNAAFVGYYGQSHAGKNSKSDVYFGEGSLGSAEDSLAKFKQQHAVQRQVTGVSSALGGAYDGSNPGGAPSTYRKQYPDAGQDNLTNATAGLVGKPGTDERKPMYGMGALNNRARVTSITATDKGLSSNEAPQSTASKVIQYVPSALVNKPGGLMQAGEAPPLYAPWAGKTNASSLQNGQGGMSGNGGGYVPMSRHAGKNTASSIMQRDNGITLLPRNMAAPRPQYDTYQNIQMNQMQQKLDSNMPIQF